MAFIRSAPDPGSSPETVLVTGCSSGLGCALCECLSTVRTPSGTRAYRVFATARRLETIKDLEAKGIETRILDVCSEESVKECVESIVEAAGKIDVMIANAGVLSAMPLIDQPVKQIQDMLDVNVLGVVRVIQAVAPYMITKKKGTIVNIGSASGYLSTPFASTYCGSKACLMSMTNSLRMELSPWGINVLSVETGTFKSSIAANGVQRVVLPENTPYASIKKAVEDQLSFSQNDPGSKSAEQTAKQIVVALIKTTPPFTILAGGRAAYYKLVGFISMLFPGLLFNTLCSKFGLKGVKVD